MCCLCVGLSCMPHNIVITVADNGLGIEKKHQEKVFGMFYRANEQVSGSGLGLYIVKETLDKLQGHIAMESSPGIGTTFTVYVPNRLP